jgi:predicted AAA+ superfamily ATPase
VATPAYRRRIVDDELDELLPALPALALEGAKGVGKTATALERAATVHELDDPAQRAIAEADPSRLLAGPTPVLIDEWQRVPDTWDLVRRAVDAGTPPGSYLLTGSASPAGLATHSGAARIVTVRLRPLSLAERDVAEPTVCVRSLLSGEVAALGGSTTVGIEAYVEEILASGFPGLRGYAGRALRAQLDGYLDRIVDSDFEELGRRIRNPSALRRWLAAYAAASSTTATYESIRDAATGGEGEKPARSTTLPYRDALERLWILDPVAAWLPSRSRLARLGRAAKHQLADPALAARLLGLDAGALLDASADATAPSLPRDGTLLGSLFESLVTLSVRTYAQATEAAVGYLRTSRGDHEVDLVIERADGRVVAVEVKVGRVVRDEDVRHLIWLRERLGPELIDAVVVTSGEEAFRRADGIGVVPAALLGP